MWSLFARIPIQFLSCRYGDSLLVLEELALSSVKDFVHAVKKHNEQPLDPQTLILQFVADVLAQLVSCNDQEFSHWVRRGRFLG